MDETKETIICGNNTTGVTQDSGNAGLHLWCQGLKLLSMANQTITLYAYVPGRKGANVASASTTALGFDGTLIPITGSTVINHFSTYGRTAGVVIIMTFIDGTTVVHNAAAPPANTAAIKLTGGVDYVATADSTLTVVYNGTYWLETARGAYT